MKCRARHHVYSTRATESGNPALANIAGLEEQILREAERDWRSALQRWALGSRHERSTLLAVLGAAKAKARQDVRVVFDDPVTTELLAKFFETLQPEALIPAEGAS